jgi:hypothetical protein
VTRLWRFFQCTCCERMCSLSLGRRRITRMKARHG